METRRRVIAKAVTWQCTGMVVTTAIGYALTGSVETGGALAGASALISIFFYVGHERAWTRVRWGVLPEAAGD